MKRKFIAMGVLAFVLFTFMAPERVEAQQRDITYRAGTDTGGHPFVVTGGIQVIRLVGGVGNPSIVETNNGRTRAINPNGEIIGNDPNNIKFIRTSSNQRVEFITWNTPQWSNPGSGRHFNTIQPSSEVEFTYGTHRNNPHITFHIKRGSLIQNASYSAANSLDDMMTFLASVNRTGIRNWVNTLKSQNRNLNDSQFADLVIERRAQLSGTYTAAVGSLMSQAPTWMLPAEYAVVWAQYALQAQTAFAVACVYWDPNSSSSRLSDDDFKMDLYILFADDHPNTIAGRIIGGGTTSARKQDLLHRNISASRIRDGVQNLRLAETISRKALARALPSAPANPFLNFATAAAGPLLNPFINATIDGVQHGRETRAFGQRAKSYYAR